MNRGEKPMKSNKNKPSKQSMTSWHVGVAAEAIAAAQFARAGYYVSVQYGANQPEYDLIAESNDLMLKISVKGSKDGRWGLTQSYLKDANYHEAVRKWLDNHHKKTIFCLVQFSNTELNEMPRVYLATPDEIAKRLNDSARGRGETILYENHKWGPAAAGYGTVDRVPDEWLFTKERVDYMFQKHGK